MIKYILPATLLAFFSLNHVLAARYEIRIVGSPEVLPYVQKVAEDFILISDFGAPSLEVTGTGTGFRLFCDGIGFEYPDINAASRRITDAEFAVCRENGVTSISEIIVGLAGIVLANSKAAKQYNFTTSQLFEAVAANVVKNGQIVKNTVATWQENDDKIAVNSINGVLPTAENITNGRYALARPIYLYVKNETCRCHQRIATVPVSVYQ